MPKKHVCTAKETVNSILDRDIITVDWLSMPVEARREWGAFAKSALENPAIQHLIGKSSRIVSNKTTGEVSRRCIENVARYSRDHVETENIRHIMIGAELIRELLEEMLWTEEREKNEDPNAAI